MAKVYQRSPTRRVCPGASRSAAAVLFGLQPRRQNRCLPLKKTPSARHSSVSDHAQRQTKSTLDPPVLCQSRVVQDTARHSPSPIKHHPIVQHRQRLSDRNRLMPARTGLICIGHVERLKYRVAASRRTKMYTLCRSACTAPPLSFQALFRCGTRGSWRKNSGRPFEGPANPTLTKQHRE